MKYLNTILGGLAVAGIIAVYFLIKGDLKKIMANQASFDEQIAKANTALDGIGEAIAAESKQISDFIAANPNTDTSALDGVVSRLEGVAASVGTVFEPPTSGEESPAEEAPATEETSG